MLINANIFPATLNTSVSSPNGIDSSVPDFNKQYALNDSIFIPANLIEVRNSGTRNSDSELRDSQSCQY
jgi:hypothetical protein